MILAIDIGNTNVKFGVFDGQNLIKRIFIPTVRSQTAPEILHAIGESLFFKFRDVIISSVVPELDDSFTQLIQTHFQLIPRFVTHQFDFGFQIEYFPPTSVGIDRLVGAYGAARKYGIPCILCDLGTATNIEVVNSENIYLGGIITAGMKLLADSLHQKAAKLPRIELQKPAKVIGNTTLSAIQSGVFNGYVALIDGLIGQTINELGEKPQVIGTGGLVKILAESSKFIEIVDENLLLESLRLISEKHN